MGVRRQVNRVFDPRAVWREALVADVVRAYRQAGLDNDDGLLPPASPAEIDGVARAGRAGP